MMEFARLQIFYLVAFIACPNDGAKILGIFPHPAKSRFAFNNEVMKSLIEAGHEVTLITSNRQQAATENYTSIIDVSIKERIAVDLTKTDDFVTQNIFKVTNFLSDYEEPFCTAVLNSPEVQKILKSNEKLYDVVFVEIIFWYKCYLYLAEKIKIPVIGTVSMRTWLPADISIYNPHHPAYISPELVTQKWPLSSITGRIMNTWNYIVITLYSKFFLPNLIRKFHNENVDKLESLGEYMDMEPELMFYNNHASLLPRPMNPNAIDVGGIHIRSAKQLPQDIEKFIDDANHGVILFTLGSVARAATLISEKRNVFRDAFAEIPQRVIWKFEEKIENLSSNVMTLNWLPQRDILEHKNVIGFISHCGLGGINEAVYTATPVIACPLFFDQHTNAELLEDLGVAVHLDIYDITKENILGALNAITNVTRYFDNMQKLSKKFKDRPMTPQQSIVYWTEHVIRHNGASHLISPASRLNWFQFLMLDVAFTVAVILVLVTYFMKLIIKTLYSHFKRTKTANKIAKSKNKKD